MKCAAHPQIETSLSCGGCGIPICPKCMVATPVGYKCRKCAGLKRLPTFEVTPVQFARAAVLGLGAAILVGVVWGLIGGFIWLFSILLAAAAGYVIAEVITVSANRKRGRILQILAAFCVLAAFLISLVTLDGGALSFSFRFSIFNVLSPIIGIVVAVSRLQ